MAILNAFLQPLGAPVTSQRGTIGYLWDTTSDRGMVRAVQIQDASITNAKIGTAAIGTANIGTLTFNEISGGTATLGGTSNGNGLLTVNNAAGTEVVKIDNTGITVNGSMTMKNSAGTTIMDATGLVSAPNFTFSGTYANNQQTTTSATPVDLGSMSLSLPLTRPATVLFLASAGGYAVTDISNDSLAVAIVINGTVNYPALSSGGLTGGLSSTGATTHLIQSMTAGTHTVKLQYTFSSGGSGTAYAFDRRLTYLVLGT